MADLATNVNTDKHSFHVQLFKHLANSRRLAILYILLERPHSGQELLTKTKLSQAILAQQLSKLRKALLVIDKRFGKGEERYSNSQRMYYLANIKTAEILKIMKGIKEPPQ
jgi:DNA-binding transcriptional ArsR family regulator